MTTTGTEGIEDGQEGQAKADTASEARSKAELQACLEAILMVADQPVQTDQVARALEISPARADSLIQDLARSYGQEGRGFQLKMTSQGWQLSSRPEFESVVSAFVTDGQTARLSQAALEALAIIAYKQPVTRAQVAAIRGVNSDGVIRSLSVRGLIREQGEDEESQAALLVTSGLFLDKMGIRTVGELPSLAPFLPVSARDVAEEAVLA